MKIVHSFWSKPTINQNVITGKVHGGWRHNKYHYMSWALSCLSFKKQYEKIELLTDSIGKKILIDQLKLPYTSFRLDLERLDKYPKQLWAIGKLIAYSVQNEPFLHVDGDVYVWEKFENEIETAQLVGQHLDIEEGHYYFALKLMKNLGISLPYEMIKDFSIQQKFGATNAGILGGTNLDFFKEYAKRSFWFIDKNLNKVNPNLIGSSYALIYEQYLFSVLARKKGISVKHYLKDKEEDILGLSNFIRRYGPRKYVHLLSKTKFTFESCRELELNLLLDFPEYHERINKIFA